MVEIETRRIVNIQTDGHKDRRNARSLSHNEYTMNTESTSEILDSLAETSSRNQKLSILQQHQDNTTLRRVFDAALNPFVQYWIRSVPEKTEIPDSPQSLDWGLDQLQYLIDRTYTGHAGVAHLDHIIQSLSIEDAYIIQMIVFHRDLRCGVSDKTVNKVWPKLIPEFPVMACSKNDVKLLNKMTYPAFAQKKEDGARLIVTVAADGTVGYFARSGRELSEHFGKVFDPIFLNLLESKCPEGFALDGELLSFGSDRQTGNGLITKAIRGTITEEEVDSLYYVVWDLVPLDAFWNAHTKMPYSERFEKLSNLLSELDTNKVELVYSKLVNNLQEAEAVFEKMLADGFEGIILKNSSGPFEGSKRAKHQIKFKAEKTADLRIYDLIEGTGKYAGMLGAFRMGTDESDLIVNVGSGLSDAQRREIWDNPDSALGKIGEVKYNALINNKSDSVYSLFLPVFKCVRNDKTSSNTLGELE